jgi:sugar/nucleoside kinase (ribokinase family)
LDRYYFSVGSIIIDDIVLPDGQTHMGVLGGGAAHAAMGMRVWSEQVGLVSSVGEDFSEEHRKALRSAFDLHGLVCHGAPTVRAWQVFEADGQRTEVFRTDFEEFLANAPTPEQLPGVYDNARGVHLLSGVPELFLDWVKILRLRGVELILWEPWDIYCQPENRAEFRRLLPLVDVFSPNLTEARHITGQMDVEQVAKALLSYGVKCVAIRMGENGSLIADNEGQLHSIPAVKPDKLVDVTGAGNAYCGGFIVGLSETGDSLTAGQYGSVSASLALEQYGAIYQMVNLTQKAQARLSVCKNPATS